MSAAVPGWLLERQSSRASVHEIRSAKAKHRHVDFLADSFGLREVCAETAHNQNHG